MSHILFLAVTYIRLSVAKQHEVFSWGHATEFSLRNRCLCSFWAWFLSDARPKTTQMPAMLATLNFAFYNRFISWVIIVNSPLKHLGSIYLSFYVDLPLVMGIYWKLIIPFIGKCWKISRIRKHTQKQKRTEQNRKYLNVFIYNWIYTIVSLVT